jgi:hypothetical protein
MYREMLAQINTLNSLHNLSVLRVSAVEVLNPT